MLLPTEADWLASPVYIYNSLEYAVQHHGRVAHLPIPPRMMSQDRLT